MLPWNASRNGFYRSALRLTAGVVAVLALKLAAEWQDPIGFILGGSLAAHLIITSKGRKKS